jgi:uncharacterized protein (TIGR03067 family)
MKHPCIVAFVSVLSCYVYGGCGGPTSPAPAGLEGSWVGQELQGPPGECRMTVAGSQMKFQGARSNEWYTANLTLNPTTDPKQALLQIQECSFPQYLNKSAHGIYLLETNRLLIAATEPGAEQPPTGFERSASNHVRVFVFTKR